MRSEKESSPTRHKKEHSVINSLSLPFETMVVLRGQSELTVYGCKKILLYTKPEIRLSMPKKQLCILGEDLLCTSFTGGAVTVEGKIEAVRYERIERERE